MESLKKFLGLTLALLLGTLVPNASATSYYLLRSEVSGLCLTYIGGCTSDMATSLDLIECDFTGSNLKQKWSWEPSPNWNFNNAYYGSLNGFFSGLGVHLCPSGTTWWSPPLDNSSPFLLMTNFYTSPQYYCLQETDTDNSLESLACNYGDTDKNYWRFVPLTESIPSLLPTVEPTAATHAPSITAPPTEAPTLVPSSPTGAPTYPPSSYPTALPSSRPSALPSSIPSFPPTISIVPSGTPTAGPTLIPSYSQMPIPAPTRSPYAASTSFDDNSFLPFSSTGYSWTLNSYGTPSSGTGPSGDHTSGGGYYAYVESSSPNFPNIGPFLLETDVPYGISSVEFWYSMYGSFMGSLSFEVSNDDGSSWITLWSKSGNQGTDWQQAQIDYSNNGRNVTTVRFSATTGSSFTSDMAIDDVSILHGLSSPSFAPTTTHAPSISTSPSLAPTNTPTSLPTKVPTPTTVCMTSIEWWAGDAVDLLRFNYANGDSVTYGSVGGSAQQTVYLDWTENEYIVSAQQDISDSFYNLHYLGSGFIFTTSLGNTITLSAVTAYRSTMTSVFTASDDNAVKELIFTSNTLSGVVEDEFGGCDFDPTMVPTTTLAPSVSPQPTLLPTPTPFPTMMPTNGPVIISADFDDNSFSPFSSTGYSWTLNSYTTSSSGTGPSEDHTSGGGYYAYVEASSPNFPNIGPFLLETDVSNTGISSVEFWYSMYGSLMGSLSFEVSNDGGSSWTALWSKSGNQGTDWQQAQIDYINNGRNVTTVRFSATTGSDFTSDMAIDDVSIYGFRIPECTEDCSAEVLSALGDQDVFCSLNDISCTDDCGAEYIAAHCECDTGALFTSFSFDFMGDTYCCGSDACQDAILDMYSVYSFSLSYGFIETYLDSTCTAIDCSTPEPTLAPTTVSTISTDVELSIVASGPPSNADKTSIKATISNTTGVAIENIKKFVVTSTAVRRLQSKKETGDWLSVFRRLTDYTWDVSCSLQADTTSSSFSSSSDFAAAISSSLNSDAFQNSLVSSLNATVTSTSSVVVAAVTRNPSSLPTAMPSSLPTKQPSSTPKSSSSKKSESGLSTGGIVGISVAALFVLLCAAVGIFLTVKSSSANSAVGQQVELSNGGWGVPEEEERDMKRTVKLTSISSGEQQTSTPIFAVQLAAAEYDPAVPTADAEVLPGWNSSTTDGRKHSTPLKKSVVKAPRKSPSVSFTTSVQLSSDSNVMDKREVEL